MGDVGSETIGAKSTTKGAFGPILQLDFSLRRLVLKNKRPLGVDTSNGAVELIEHSAQSCG